MSKYRPYPKYKYSGVEWLGQVPEGWAVKKLLYISTCNDESLSESTDQDYLFDYIDISSVDLLHGVSSKEKVVFAEAPSRARRIVRRGDCLVSTVRTYLKAIAPIKFDASHVIASTGFAVIRPNSDLNSDFLSYALQSSYFIDTVCSQSTGVSYPAINSSDIMHIKIATPSRDEQKAIASSLDTELAHIDAIIEKQEHLVDLLEEKRISIISHAVTKGLNPDVPMKDSGVGWIGAAPKHWDLIRTKHLFAIKKRIAGTLGFDVLSITQKGIQIKDLEANTGQFSMDYSKYQLVERGDFAMNHMDLLTGFVDISNYEGVTSPDYRVFSLLDRKNHVAVYFLYIFQNAYLNKIFYSLGQGVSHFGRWRLQTEQFNDFVLPVPPKDEQKAIVDYLEDELSKIDAIINKTRQAIALAKERRAAIISAAVTGKICVCRPQSVEKPLSKSLEYFQKVVLAAEITDQLHTERTFGRVKLQKILYLSEYHAQLPFQRSEYQRYAAGPHDPKAMYSIEGQMKKQKWFDSRLRESGYGKEYVPLERHKAYKPYYERYFEEKHEVIQRIIDLLRPKDTQFCEVVATLYGVWNDFLLEGQQPDDAALFREAVTNWAPEKKRVPQGLWPKALHWMRENGLVPSGWGEPTIHRQEA